MTPFRIGIIIFCAAASVVALLVFSGVLPGFKQSSVGIDGDIVLWSTLPSPSIDKYFSDLNRNYKSQFNLSYVAKNPQTFEAELVDALARGQGPDLVLMPHESLLHQEDKFFLMPYEFLPEDVFNQTFVPGAQIFKRSDGLLALPVYVDPLVMYYNDALLAQSNVALAPRFWTEISNPVSDGILKKVTRIDDRNNVSQSLIALGSFNNIAHAKDILAAIFMQAGDPIVSGVPGSLSEGLSQSSEVALNFFVQFSDPTKEQYTWSSALPLSSDAFSAGKLALYLGQASDLAQFIKINPHFVPSVTMIPQRDQASNQTFGRFYALSITKASTRKTAALAAVKILTDAETAKFFGQQVQLPPARRDLIAAGSSDPNQAVFYRAALVSKAWFDVNPDASVGLFRTMVQNVLSGFEDSTKAIGRTANQLIIDQ